MANKKRRNRRNFTADRERPPLLDGEPESPFVVVHRLLRSAKRDQANAVNTVRDEARQQVRRQRDRHVGLAREVATTLHELRGLLERHDAPMREAGLDVAAETLAALHRRLAKVLQSTGVRMIDPVGEPYLAVADHSDVKERPGGVDDAGLVVGKTITPGLLLDDGELVRPAEVFLEPAVATEKKPAEEAPGQAKEPAEAAETTEKSAQEEAEKQEAAAEEEDDTP